MNKIVSDHLAAYESIVPKEKHLKNKGGNITDEGYNSLFRNFLARMRRKAKCYSKSKRMLDLSMLLLMHHRNGTLYRYV